LERALPIDLVSIAILFFAGLAAGTINSIAGGGSLFTLPLLIFLGLPPTVANGTNRIAIVSGSIGATMSFRRRGLIPLPWLKLAAPPALLGVVLGTWGAARIGDLAFQRILAVVLVVAAVWVVWNPMKPPTEGNPPPPDGGAGWLARGVFFAIGLYGGFIQAGVGFMVLGLTSAHGLDLIRGNAIKGPLVLVFTTLAVVLLAFSGLVDWVMGLTLASGQVFGAMAGVRLQVLKGQAWVRNVLTAVIIVFALRLLFMG
jgi:uncharacterized membrane protein YfcA